MYNTSIGIEIEVNNFNNTLRSAMDSDVWKRVDEHCGSELRSKVCRGPFQIRKMLKTLKTMHKSQPGKECGFSNAGTHLHIDFVPNPNTKNPRKKEDLTKIDSSKRREYFCEDCQRNHEEESDNPFNTKFYYIDKDDKPWRTPQSYIQAWRPKKERGVDIWGSKKDKHKSVLLSVKRFLGLGIRFAHVMFALQHPERHLNKYCHTIEFWNESTLNKSKSVQSICVNPRLLGSHRRHMLNPLAFQKFGTVEIRMMRATLDPDEIWEQIYFFVKLSSLAKKHHISLPESSGNIALDFVTLTNAAGIHGRMRRRLADRIVKNNKLRDKATHICFICGATKSAKDFIDYGLSRPVCKNCHSTYVHCEFCGRRYERGYHASRLSMIDGKGHSGRHACGNCGAKLKNYMKNETKKRIYLMGKLVSGIDKNGAPIQRVYADG